MKYLHQLISKRPSHAYKFHGTPRFIDDLCTRRDNGEFSSLYKYIYPNQIGLKLKHQGGLTEFLTIEYNIFLYKVFDNRDKFSFFIVRIPYLPNNIPSLIFYGSIFSECLRIA